MTSVALEPADAGGTPDLIGGPGGRDEAEEGGAVAEDNNRGAGLDCGEVSGGALH
jgi:hypothetical protein